MSQWWHPTISSSATPFTSCPQSFPASRSFPMSWLFPSGGQSIGASASNEQSGLISFHIDWFDLLAVPGTHKSSSAPQFESINSSVPSLFYGPTHIHTRRLEKIITLTIWTFVSQVMSLLLFFFLFIFFFLHTDTFLHLFFKQVTWTSKTALT